MEPFVIEIDDPRRDDVRALLEVHLAFARSVTPPEGVHALDLDGLLDPTITFFSVRADDSNYSASAPSSSSIRNTPSSSRCTPHYRRGGAAAGARSSTGPGEAYLIEPGHDAWIVGDQRFVGFEFDARTAEEYAKG